MLRTDGKRVDNRTGAADFCMSGSGRLSQVPAAQMLGSCQAVQLPAMCDAQGMKSKRQELCSRRLIQMAVA